jgi:hypothetical protein
MQQDWACAAGKSASQVIVCAVRQPADVGISGVSTNSWNGSSGDWNTGSDWSGGVPSATTTASIAGNGAYVVTLFGAGSAAGLIINAAGAEFYDAGALTLGGLLALQSGTLALAYGAINGGTLAMEGGSFLSTGGLLNGVQVDGVLGLTAAQSTLFVENGLSLTGTNGSGAGSIALTGAYASLDFVGSQTLRGTTIGIGASGTQPGQTGAATLDITHATGATAGATLTLGGSDWVRDSGGQAQVVTGSLSPGMGASLPDELLNLGTISASSAGATLVLAGSGTLVNQGTLSVSNGALLEIATAGFQNTGTLSVNNATLSLGGTFATSLLSGLGHVGLSDGKIEIAGQANLGGTTLNVGNGTSITGSLGALLLTGTLAGGTLADSGGGVSFAAGSGTLSGVTYAGTLSLAGTASGVTLTNGSEVTGGIGVTGNGADLLLLGSETLANVTISLGAAGQAAAIGTADAWLASTATTATLGSTVTVQQTGLYAALQANGLSPIAGLGLADTLVNQGLVTAALAGGTLSVSGYGTFINEGRMAISGGDALLVTVGTFGNAGTITIGAGGTATFGQASSQFGQQTAWTNAGEILVDGGTLVLEGYATTSQLGTVQENGGLVTFAGTLSNTGSTVVIGSANGLADVSLTGTVIGGAITDGSSALSINSAGTALLENVNYQGTLALTQTGAVLNVRDGLAVSGQVHLLGAGATLDFIGTQAFNSTTVSIGNASQASTLGLAHDYGASGASTLTLGSGLTINQVGSLAAIGASALVLGDGIVNAGTINADFAGGTLTLDGQNFTNQGQINVGDGDTLAIDTVAFSNTGTLAINDASLALGGSLTLAGLGQMNLANATISIGGTLNLGGATLDIGQGSSIGRVSLTGTLANGTISDAGGGLAGSGTADLSDITYLGLLDLTRPFAQLSFSNGLTVTGLDGSGAGSIQITGAETRLIALGDETLDNCAITLGSPLAVYGGQTLTVPELAPGAGSVLTIGPDASITLAGAGGNLGDSGLGRWTDSIINNGTITTALSGDTLTLGSTNFLNNSSITVEQSGILYINDAEFQNTGTLTVGAASVVQVSLFDYFASPQSDPTIFSNAGNIAMEGGILHEMNAGGLFPFVPFENLAGAAIEGTGTFIAPVDNSGLIEAVGGTLAVTSAISGSGSLLIAAGATLDLANTVSAGQMVDFASASSTLQLNQPTLFAGTLENYVGGDVIDLPGQTLWAVAISNGTLAINTSTQALHLAANVPLTGALEAGHDGHGGATIAITPKGTGGVGAGPPVLSVYQPNMMFWTTPSGDILQGDCANMNGTDLCNWANTSSLDITDLAPSLAKISVTASGGATDIAVTDGKHSFSMSFGTPIAAHLFHLASDGHGGTIITT